MLDKKNRAEIISREKQLHTPAIRHQRQRIEEILHAQFFEIGRSGRRFNREVTIASLTQETDAVQIFSDGFELTQIEGDVVMLTYRSYQLIEGKPIRQTMRTSIWTKAGEDSDNWQMRFHQGTPVG